MAKTKGTRRIGWRVRWGALPWSIRWALVGVALMLLSGYRWQSVPSRAVQVVVAHWGPLSAEWSAPGYVECRTAQVSAPQTGRVIEVTVREGDRVCRGQVLARLASSAEAAAVQVQRSTSQAAGAQLQAASAEIREAERGESDRVIHAGADVSAARARWQAARAVLERDREVARANAAAAQSQLQVARSELADLASGARAAEIEQAESTVAAAEAVAERARTEHARQTLLLQEGAVSQRASDDASADLGQAEASLRRARASLSLLRQGSRPQEIETARARAQVAVAQVASAAAQVIGLATEARSVEGAAAELKAAEAALAEARSARLHLHTLQCQVDVARARSAQSQAGVDQASAELAERTVRSPYAGFVGRRYVDPGDVAAPSKPLFSVVEAGDTWVMAEVDVQDMAMVRRGEPVSISSPAFPGRLLQGRVAAVGTQAIPQTEVRTGARIVRVRISLPPPAAGAPFRLAPGMDVDVQGNAALATRALLVPNDAILTGPSGAYLFTVSGGRARKRLVRIGFSDGTESEVLSGLQPGEMVVVSGKEGLTAGMRVASRGLI